MMRHKGHRQIFPHMVADKSLRLMNDPVFAFHAAVRQGFSLHLPQQQKKQLVKQHKDHLIGINFLTLLFLQ